jgi:hypothetical protein
LRQVRKQRKEVSRTFRRPINLPRAFQIRHSLFLSGSLFSIANILAVARALFNCKSSDKLRGKKDRIMENSDPLENLQSDLSY